MPLVKIPSKTDCIHGNIHPRWIAQGVPWALCAMPKPYLMNCITMLEATLQHAYPFVAHIQRSPLTMQERRETQDKLRMFQVELERRNDY